MRILNPEAETKAILSLLSGDKEVQSTLLSRLAKDHFAFDQMNIAFDLIAKAAASSNIPILDVFVQHPHLPQEAKEILLQPNAVKALGTEDATELANILEYWRKVRCCFELSSTLAVKLKGEAAPEMVDLVSDVEKALGGLRTVEDAQRTWHLGLGSNSDDLITQMLNEEKPRLIKSTFRNFDDKVGGFGANDLVILASHAKGGKSMVALNMLMNSYLYENLNIIMFSMEMRAAEVMERIMSSLTGIEHGKFRQKQLSDLERTITIQAWNRFQEHGIKNNCRFTIKDTTELTTAEFKLECKNRGYQIACIDYINLMRINNGKKDTPDWERLSILGRELKQATKELDLLIMAPTQMNDDGDIRYSKALKEHANTIWRWWYKEENKISHLIRVDQLVVRGWAAFPFMLKEDYERSKVMDGPLVVPEFDDSKNREKLKKMYED